MAAPARTNAIPVSTAQNVAPNGIHLGIIGTTVQTAVRCARPKSIEQSPNVCAKERVHGLSSAPLLRLVPGSHVRPPTIHIPAIFFVLWSEFAAQSWLFIKEHEQVYAKGNGDHGSNRD